MSLSFSDVLIVMPAFNEADSIANIIREVNAKLPGAKILVVNDGSKDNTATIARANGAIVADLPCNLGVGGAMRCGFQFAVQHGFDIAVQIDADGQHDPSSVPILLAQLNGAGSGNTKNETSVDVVIGSRFAGEGIYEVTGPRKWAMKFLSIILSRITQTPLTDTTSGLKAHGPRALSIFSNDYPAEYLGDTIESLVIGSRSGLVFSEVAVSMRDRTTGTPSHNPLKSTVYLARAFIALAIALLRPKVLQP